MRGRGPSGVGAVPPQYWLAVLGLLGILTVSWAASEAPGPGLPAILTNAQQVLDLGLERSRAGDIPARLRGVLTYQAIHKPTWFWLQDETTAVLIIVSELPFTPVSGQLIEVDGFAAPGIYAPFVQGRTVRLAGTAPLPAPKHTPPAQLALGADFGRWVEIEGTVRDVAISKSRLLLLCAEKGLLFQVWCVQPEGLPLPLAFRDARVQLQGVSWADVGYERPPFGFKLHQPGTNFIRVLQPGSADIFTAPSRSIQSLRQFKGDRNARVKVTGVVTLHSPAGWLYLQDDTGSLCAQQLAVLPRDDDPRGQFLRRSQPALKPGDQIELVGAPLTGQPFAPQLDDAEYRVVGHTSPPPARVLSSTDLMSGRHDAELVNLKAQVLDVENRLAGELFVQRLWLHSGDSTFEVALETRERKMLAVRKNDFVAVNGVCSVQPGRFQQVRSFNLHLRGPSDLTVTRPPAWWTLRWAAWLLAGGCALVAAAVVWITLLRRQVARRTAELSAANAHLQDEIQKRRRFVSVIEATSDLVAMASLDGQVLYLNRAGRRMMELPDEVNIVGMKMWDFYPEDVNRLFREVALPQGMRDGIWIGEVRLLSATKREIPVSFVGLVIKTADGTPEHLACVVRDLEERRRIEEDLRAALAAEKELSQLKSNFVSMVSHEFRTPLGAIQSSAELLHNYHDRLTPERREKLLSAIVTSTSDMARMMEDVLLLSQVETARYDVHRREVVLAELCHRLADEAASATRGRCPIHVQTGAIPETAWGDEGLLRHIFNNLLSNAVKYSTPGVPVEFHLDKEGDHAVFTVRDRGLGIPAEEQTRLFQAFMRGSNVSQTPGTGLGLVIVHRCVTLHGGTVRVESALGRGTTVTVRLPLFAAKAPDTALLRRRAPSPV